MRKIHIRQTTTTRATHAEQSTSGEGSGNRKNTSFLRKRIEKFSIVNSHVFPPPPLSSFGYVYVCLEEKKVEGATTTEKDTRRFSSLLHAHTHFLSRIVSLSRIFRPFHRLFATLIAAVWLSHHSNSLPLSSEENSH